MDEPELDEVNVTTDDVLADDRQRELDEFVGNLEQAAPGLVAVERPASRTDAVNDVYARYRNGSVSYAEEHEFTPRHPDRDDETVACRSEVIQVGFRLADRFNHNRVVSVDVPERLGDSPDFEAFEESGYEPTPKIDIPRFDNEDLQTSLDDRLADSTITEYHRYLNEEAALHYTDGMFDEFLRYGDGENYAGPDALAKWYRRNLRMVHNIWQAVTADTERVLLVVGSGHVHILRHLLTEFPQFCPVSPLQYLPRDG